MEGLRQDLRYAFRTLLQHRGFTAVAVATLALGVGANTAIFTVVNALLLRPLAVADPDRLVVFGRGEAGGQIRYPEYVDFHTRNQVFTGLAASGIDSLALGWSAGTHVVLAEMVSGNYFSVMSVGAHRGRLIVPDDDRAPGASPVAVVSHAAWKRLFGADPNLVGSSVALNGQPFTIVGIAPDGFVGAFPPASVDLWTPLMMAPLLHGTRGADILSARGRALLVIGRLPPGIGLGEAQAATRLIDRQIQEAHPETDRRRASTNAPWDVGDVTLLRLRAFFGPSIRRVVGTVTGLVMALVFLVLLIACANVANLLLARAAARRREVAIRLALGASRARIVRQLLTESLLLSLAGAGAGLLLALWTADLLIKVQPPVGGLSEVVFAPDVSLDSRVLGFTLIISIVTGLLFGLAPALQASRPDVVPALKNEVSAGGPRSRRAGVRSLLVVGQVAVSLVLLIVTGMFVRSVQQTQTIDPGFETANGLVMKLDPERLGYTPERAQQFYQRLRERITGLPGVRAVSLATYLPFGDMWTPSEAIAIEGRQRPPDAPPLMIGTVSIDPSHLPTLGIALAGGRNFTEEDTATLPPVVIVSAEMARRFWPGKDAIGKRLASVGPLVDSMGITPRESDATRYRRVVGVVEDIKYQVLSEQPRPVMYLPLAQRYSSSLYVVVRAGGDPGRVVSALRQEVRALDRNLPIEKFKTLAEHVDIALGLPRLLASIVGTFGLLAIVLAAVGIYGVVAYSVSQRTREIGIRVALGADRRAILKLVVGRGMALVLVGVVLGLPTAIAARRLLWGLLHDFTLVPAEPLLFVGLSLLLALVGLLASYVPSRRATRVDPLVALRAE